jgi:hypothetical protein
MPSSGFYDPLAYNHYDTQHGQHWSYHLDPYGYERSLPVGRRTSFAPTRGPSMYPTPLNRDHHFIDHRDRTPEGWGQERRLGFIDGGRERYSGDHYGHGHERNFGDHYDQGRERYSGDHYGPGRERNGRGQERYSGDRYGHGHDRDMQYHHR